MFLDRKNSVCRRCHENCLSCFGKTEFECFRCVKPYFLTEISQCVLTECPKDTYTNYEERICENCDKSCKSCLGNPRNCSGDCNDNYLIFGDYCVEICPEGYVEENRRCMPCIDGCSICENTLTCMKCKKGFAFFNGTCINACPDGYYMNPKLSICTKCDPACSTCSSSGSDACLSCNLKSGYFMVRPGTCVKQICFKGEYMNPINFMCYRCSPRCGACNAGGEEDCLECKPGYIKNSTLITGKCYRCQEFDRRLAPPIEGSDDCSGIFQIH